MSQPSPALPDLAALLYRDTKPQGAADFYFAINATFRFILTKLGREAWLRYLEQMAAEYFGPVSRRWQEGGAVEIARYWRAFFAAEPGAEVEVTGDDARVEIVVRRCPAIAHLRAAGRTIVPEYCQHCYVLGEARARAAGFAMRLEGGNGACRHTYCPASAAVAPQDWKQIKEAR